MYEVSEQITTQLCVCVFLYVLHTALSLSYIIKNPVYNNINREKTLTTVMFYLLLFMCVIYNNNGDYYTYRRWFLYGYGETAETDDWFEPIYYWIKAILPPFFIFFRVVIWGTGIYVYKKLCEKLGLNLLLSYILFGVFYTYAYSYARVSLGIMIISYAFVLLVSTNVKSKVFYIKLILLFAFATLLHKSCLSLIFILLSSLILKFNKKTLILLAILFVPISLFIIGNIDVVDSYIGLTESQSERYLSTNNDVSDRSTEIYKHIPFLILLLVSIVKIYKNKKSTPTYMERIVMGTITILYTASILTTISSISMIQTIAIRYYLMAYVLALICCIYTIQKFKINQMLLIFLICYCTIYHSRYILYKITHGALDLVQRYYN